MSQTSAQQEPWWDDFVREYGDVPLRELARKYGTNPRRLRRAAQRSGLAAEPLVLRKNTTMLGSVPDATVAERLGVTREAVQGARARRRIGAYDNRASKKRKSRRSRRAESPQRPAPRTFEAPKRRFRPDDAPPPVVVSRGPRRASRAGTERLGGRKIEGLGASPREANGERPAGRTTRRRRIVSAEGREPRDKKDPAPAESIVWRRKPRKRELPPVRVVYDKKLEQPAPPVAAEPVQAEAEPLPVVPEPVLPEPVLPEPVLPEPLVAAPEPAPKLYWQARVQLGGKPRELVIQASTLSEAAAHAESQGTVLALGRAAMLGA